MQKGTTPLLSEAFARSGNFDGLRAICPHCGATVAFEYVSDAVSARQHGPRALLQGRQPMQFRIGTCPGCNGAVIGALFMKLPGIGVPVALVAPEAASAVHCDFPAVSNTGQLLWPHEVWPDQAPEGLSSEIRPAYDEARNILALSSTGAAVLARRCLQHVIRAKLGIKKKNLFEAIQEAVNRPELSHPARQSLDHVREIGNWGAHPIESNADPANTIIEVTREEAEYTLRVLEMLFHDLYVAPQQAAAMSAAIKAKK